MNVKKINELLKEKQKTKSQLAKYLGVSETAVYKMFRTKNAKSSTLERIARFFNVPISQLYETSSRVEDPQTSYGVSKSIINKEMEDFVRREIDDLERRLAIYKDMLKSL